MSRLYVPGVTVPAGTTTFKVEAPVPPLMPDGEKLAVAPEGTPLTAKDRSEFEVLFWVVRLRA